MDKIILELKSRREAKGISISEVARRMGTNYARISEIEHGRGGLTLKRLIAWADALGLKVNISFEEK